MTLSSSKHLKQQLFAVGFVAVIGCSSSSPTNAGSGGNGGFGGSIAGGAGGHAMACVPGQQVACACSDGTQGAQACDADGSGYLACACTSANGGAGIGGNSAAGASGGGIGGGSGGSGGVPGAAGQSEAGAASENAGAGGECSCFQHGNWSIADLSPCIFTSDQTTVTGMTSSYGSVQCGDTDTMAPASTWSTDTLEVDCSGHYKVCFTLKAGDPNNPKVTDCSIAQVCSESDYTAPGSAQAFPPLPGWFNDTDLACMQQFYTSGGYGEMSVDGVSNDCGPVDRVFQRISFCANACSLNPNTPQCQACQSGPGGQF